MYFKIIIIIIPFVLEKGIAFDGPDGKDITIVKKEGKVVALEDELLSCELVSLTAAIVGLCVYKIDRVRMMQ